MFCGLRITVFLLHSYNNKSFSNIIELINYIGLEPKERLSRQQKLLRKRLGLDIAPGIDVGMDKLFDDEDLIVSAQEGKGKSLTKQKSFEVGKPQSS